MNCPSTKDGFVAMPLDEFEELLELAAERGARRALADVGLVDENAAQDVRELRSLLGALQVAKRTALQTAVRLFTTGLVLALMAGAAVKFNLFEGD